jgi:adenylate cyclase
VHSPPAGTALSRPETEDVLEQLERIFASHDFDASPRSRAFLRYVVEETLAGRHEGFTQATIATKVFERREDFDPTVDPIVRIQAGRLRRSLERYYLLSGPADPVRIELPRGTYVPILRWAVREDEPEDGKRAAPRSPVPDEGWPTLLVSLADHGGTDPELEEPGRRFLDHLAVELDRHQDVRVALQSDADRHGAFLRDEARFILSCHLSREGERPSLIARLVDSLSGRQVWADEYRGEPDEPSAFAEETARVVAARVASEQGFLTRLLWAEQRARPPGESGPYGAILASYHFFFHRDPADLAPAIEALRRVVADRPECSLAWTQLSRLYTANNAFDVASVETPLARAVECGEHGVRLSPSSQRARVALAGALLLEGELAACRAEADKALELNPDSLVYLEWIGWLLTMTGDWERGPDLVRRALSRNPDVIPVAHHALWLAHLRNGEIEESYQAALRYRDPTFFLRALTRACSLGHLGRVAEARAEVAELLARKPEFASRGRELIGRLVKFPALVEKIVDGLEKAGLALDRKA